MVPCAAKYTSVRCIEVVPCGGLQFFMRQPELRIGDEEQQSRTVRTLGRQHAGSTLLSFSVCSTVVKLCNSLVKHKIII